MGILTIEADAFEKALSTVAPALSLRHALPILHGVRLHADGDDLHVTASDLETTITTAAPAAGSLDAVVPHALLLGAVKNCHGALGIAVKDNALVVEHARGHASINTLDLTEWPRLAEADGDEVKLDETQARAVASVLYAASTDPAWPELHAVSLSAAGAATTDKYRLAYAAIELPLDVLLPARRLAGALDGPVVVRSAGRHTALISGPTTWTLRSLETKFPNYRQLIRGESSVNVTVGRQALVDAIDAVLPLGDADTKNRSTLVRLTPGTDGVVIEARGQGGAAVVSLDATGALDFTVGFNGPYLREAAKTVAAEEITIGLVDALKPLEIHDGDSAHIIMPIRLPGA